MNSKIFLVVLLSIATFSASAQKLSGNISPLKNQKEVNVVIDFSGTNAEGRPEATYIEIKTKGKTDEQIAQFLTELNEQLRNDAYKSLTEKMNDVVQGNLFIAGDYPNAECTIYVTVKDYHPGIFLMRNSTVRADVSFVKTGETVPFATLPYKAVVGKFSSNVPLWVTRTAMAFGYLGDSIGKVVAKNLK
jgi:hypothetical protein